MVIGVVFIEYRFNFIKQGICCETIFKEGKHCLLHGFGYPIILSAIQMLVSAICSWTLAFLKRTPVRYFTKEQYLHLSLFSTLFWINIALGNSALHLNSVAFVQIFRSLIPGIEYIS